jgi:hypothetical protein
MTQATSGAPLERRRCRTCRTGAPTRQRDKRWCRTWPTPNQPCAYAPRRAGTSHQLSVEARAPK